MTPDEIEEYRRLLERQGSSLIFPNTLGNVQFRRPAPIPPPPTPNPPGIDFENLGAGMDRPPPAPNVNASRLPPGIGVTPPPPPNLNPSTPNTNVQVTPPPVGDNSRLFTTPNPLGLPPPPTSNNLLRSPGQRLRDQVQAFRRRSGYQFTPDSVMSDPIPNALGPQSEEEARSYSREGIRDFILGLTPYGAGQDLARGVVERDVPSFLSGLGSMMLSGAPFLSPRRLMLTDEIMRNLPRGPNRPTANIAAPNLDRTVPPPRVETTPAAPDNLTNLNQERFNRQFPRIENQPTGYELNRVRIQELESVEEALRAPDLTPGLRTYLEGQRTRLQGQIREYLQNIMSGPIRRTPYDAALERQTVRNNVEDIARHRRGQLEVIKGGKEFRSARNSAQDLITGNAPRRETQYAGLQDRDNLLNLGGPSRFMSDSGGSNFNRFTRPSAPVMIGRLQDITNSVQEAVRAGNIDDFINHGQRLSELWSQLHRGITQGIFSVDEVKAVKQALDASTQAFNESREFLRNNSMGRPRSGSETKEFRQVRNSAQDIISGAGPRRATQYAGLQNRSVSGERFTRPLNFERFNFTPLRSGELSGRQATTLVRLRDWLTESNVPHRLSHTKDGTVYVYAYHPHTNDIISIRISKDGHYATSEGVGKAVMREFGQENIFDTGHTAGRSTVENTDISRNVSGQPYHDRDVLEDALSHRLSTSPSGQFLVPPGRERVYPPPRGINPPTTEPGYLQRGRFVSKTENLKFPDSFPSRGKVELAPTQLDLFEPSKRPRLTLGRRGETKNYREVRNPAEGVLFPGRTPFDRQASDRRVSSRLVDDPKLRISTAASFTKDITPVQHERLNAISNWMRERSVQHSIHVAREGTAYIRFRDPNVPGGNKRVLGKTPESELLEIRIPSDGHVGNAVHPFTKTPRTAGNFFDLGTYRIPGQGGGRMRHTVNASGEKYGGNLETLFQALRHRLSRSSTGQFLTPPGKEPNYRAPRSNETLPAKMDENQLSLNLPPNYPSHRDMMREITEREESRRKTWERPADWIGGTPGQETLPFNQLRYQKPPKYVTRLRGSLGPRNTETKNIGQADFEFKRESSDFMPSFGPERRTQYAGLQVPAVSDTFKGAANQPTAYSRPFKDSSGNLITNPSTLKNRIEALYRSGETSTLKISNMLNLPTHFVRRVIVKMPEYVKAPRGRPMTNARYNSVEGREQIREKIIELRKEGKSTTEIGATLGASQKMVSDLLRTQPGYVRLTRHGTYALGKNVEDEIRRLTDEGVGSSEIARKLGIKSISNISQIGIRHKVKNAPRELLDALSNKYNNGLAMIELQNYIEQFRNYSGRHLNALLQRLESEGRISLDTRQRAMRRGKAKD